MISETLNLSFRYAFGEDEICPLIREALRLIQLWYRALHLKDRSRGS